MGYLNTQLEKKALHADIVRPGIVAITGLTGAATGASNAEKKDKLVSLLGGALGGSAGGLAGLHGLHRFLYDQATGRVKHPALKGMGPLSALAAFGILASGALGAGTAGSYVGSEAAKKLKHITE